MVILFPRPIWEDCMITPSPSVEANFHCSGPHHATMAPVPGLLQSQDANRLQAGTRTWLAELLELPLSTPHAHTGLQTHVGFGGLGFLTSNMRRLYTFFQATLPIVEGFPLRNVSVHTPCRAHWTDPCQRTTTLNLTPATSTNGPPIARILL